MKIISINDNILLYYIRNVVMLLSSKQLSVSFCTNIGTTRKINQDNFYINGEVLRDPYRRQVSAKGSFSDGIFAIADGMGGESDGEYASMRAVEALNMLRSKKKPSYEDICYCVEVANNEICSKITSTGKKSGTTIVLAVTDGKELNIYNIGDSKCLLYRKGTLTQLSKDHTVTAQMVEAGLLTKEQARQDRRSHQLFQHLGIFPDDMALSLFKNEKIIFEKNDVLILCSDGMTDGLDEAEIIRHIETNRSFDDLSKELVADAMKKGSKDNVSVLAIKKTGSKGSGIGSALYIGACIGAVALGAAAGFFISNISG